MPDSVAAEVERNGPSRMKLLETLPIETIKVPLLARDKRDAINELVDLLGQAGRIKDTETLKRVVWEREQQRSTGIGEGLAIPHGKSACTDDLVIAVGRPAEPIDFDSIDGRPVELIVLLASPPDKTSDHIQALGKISRMMANPSVRHAAYEAKDAEELYELFRKHADG
jgi:fructose-specific phosphotransferase system IIA component